MNASLWLANLVAWWLQASLVLGLGLLLPVLLRLSPPTARLRYWQCLLAVALMLPLVQLVGAPLRFAAEVDAGGGWLQTLATAPRAPGELGGAASAWLLAGLAAVGSARLLRLLAGLRTLHAWTAAAQPVRTLPALVEAQERVGGTARFLFSSRAASPMTFGVRRPVVLLPPGFVELAPDAQRAIACHELLHVSRRDWLATLGEEVLRAALWFHPGVWLVLARIDLAREQVIDAEVVRLTGRRRAYLAALWSIATAPANPAALPFLKRSHLRQRVAQLAQEVPMRRSRLLLRLALSTTVLASAAGLGMWSFPMAGSAFAAGPQAAGPKAVDPKPVGPKPVGHILRVTGDVQPPRRLGGKNPIYPDGPRKAKVQGVSVLECIVDTEGKTSVEEVSQSSGNAELDQAAREAVATWTFAPATLDGKRVAVYYTLTINWKLDTK